MKIIAVITETVVIREILGHLGEPKSPPRLMPGRGFSGLSGVFGAKSTIAPDGYGRITPTMALKFLARPAAATKWSRRPACDRGALGVIFRSPCTARRTP